MNEPVVSPNLPADAAAPATPSEAPAQAPAQSPAPNQDAPEPAHAPPWYDRIFAAIGYAWSWLACNLLNLRRALFRRALPDYAVITLAGELLEREPSVPWYYDLLPGYHAPMSIEYIADALRRIAKDPDVRGVIFMVKGASISLAQAESLAALFERFHRWDHANNSGRVNARAKRVVFYLEEIGGASYAAACGANCIVAPPLAEWDVKGLIAQPNYLRDTLARVGVEFDVVRVAPWKTAADSLIHNRMSEAEREQYNWLFDSLFATLVNAAAAGRKLTPAAVRELINRAPLTAPAAQAAGLLDAVAYEDELPTLLGDESKPARLKSYSRVRGLLKRKLRHAEPLEVGVISLRGSIMTGPSRSLPAPVPLFGDETLGSATAQQMIRRAAKDDSIAAVVVHVDSPGGSALASDLIWRELAELDRKKPVVVYMGDVAASGGYYIAAPGRKIVAQRATLTGSIGVIMAKPLTTGAYEKLNVGWDTVQRGEHADLYSNLTPWDGEKRAAVEANLEHVYTAFKQRVAVGRKLPIEALDDLAGGRVWTGEQALAHGLVDVLGDFERAFDEACLLAGLPTNGTVRAYAIPEGGRRLYAEPVKAAAALLRGQRPDPLALLLDFVNGGELARLLLRERAWLLADALPRLRW